LGRTALGQFPAEARLPARFDDLHVLIVLFRIEPLLARVPMGIVII
jgi:hypothetical protein